MATIYGNTTNHWRCYINTWSSEDGVSVSAGLTVGIQDCGWGFQIWTGIIGTANANGASNSVNTSFNTSTGSWSTKDITSTSQRFAKGHSAYNVTLSGSVVNQSGYMNGTSSASQTITIPALASHTVSFNANGGTGAPGSQTKWYGTVLTLSTTKPTRTNYEFLGWSTSVTGTVDYQPGGQYGADANVTLYAVWKLLYVPPKFTNGLAIRTNSITSTTVDHSGGYCYASFTYKVDTTIYPSNVAKSIVCKYYQNGSSTGVTVTPTGDLNKASGTVNIHFQASINSVYYIECVLTDTKDGTANIARSITTGVLPMEVANQGKSVGILSAAPNSPGLQLGGSGNPDFLIAADTINNKLESMAQIHGSTSSTGQGELTLSTQGTDSSGNVARGTINIITNDIILNGSSFIPKSWRLYDTDAQNAVETTFGTSNWIIFQSITLHCDGPDHSKYFSIPSNGTVALTKGLWIVKFTIQGYSTDRILCGIFEGSDEKWSTTSRCSGSYSTATTTAFISVNSSTNITFKMAGPNGKALCNKRNSWVDIIKLM